MRHGNFRIDTKVNACDQRAARQQGKVQSCPHTRQKDSFAGPSCDSFDVIFREKETVRLDVDDLLLVPDIGSYSSASATTFNGFSKAKVVVWEQVGGAVRLDAAV